MPPGRSPRAPGGRTRGRRPAGRILTSPGSPRNEQGDALVVEIFEARRLRSPDEDVNASFDDSTEVYCRITAGHIVVETDRARHGGTNPKFAAAKASLKYGNSDMQLIVEVVIVIDGDREHIIGERRFDIKSISKRPLTRSWCTLSDQAGQICISASVKGSKRTAQKKEARRSQVSPGDKRKLRNLYDAEKDGVKFGGVGTILRKCLGKPLLSKERQIISNFGKKASLGARDLIDYNELARLFEELQSAGRGPAKRSSNENVEISVVSPTKRPRAQRDVDAFRRGDTVEARYGGKSKWYKGSILRANPDGTYGILYDDGDREDSVALHLVRRTRSSSDALGDSGHLSEQESEGA